MRSSFFTPWHLLPPDKKLLYLYPYIIEGQEKYEKFAVVLTIISIQRLISRNIVGKKWRFFG
jgi:hypothetical protein